MGRRLGYSPRCAQPSRQARLNRTLLLPMPRSVADEVSLQHHTALAALRMKQGSEYSLTALMQMIVVTAFVDEASHHELRVDALRRAEKMINTALERGRTGGGWYLEPEATEYVAALICYHDDQLCHTPLKVLAKALERLENLP
ncbi:hypothetical protein PQR05_38045 [Paraburkholderia sediminicola]|uniref:hypothetical protein n=1 Tax=Paraburkholderia sediminicola TaxID=458836 RepID=UPI0038BC47EB